MYIYLELLKGVILLGIIVKSGVARFWSGAVIAAALLYLAIGLAAIGVFHRTWPLLSAVLGPKPQVTTMLAIIGSEAAASIAMWQVGARTYAKGSSGREAAELFVLPALVTMVELGLAVLIA